MGYPETNASDGATFLLDQPGIRGPYGVPEAARLRQGVGVWIAAAEQSSAADYQFIVDIQGKLDALALTATGVSAKGPTTYPLTIQWQLLAGTDCGIDYNAPVFEGVTILTDSTPRSGLLVSVRGLLASRWQLWARTLEPADAPLIAFGISGLGALNGAGSDAVVDTGSVIG